MGEFDNGRYLGLEDKRILDEGDQHVVSNQATALANTSFLDMYISNPAGSGKLMYVKDDSASTGSCVIRVARNITINTAGTTPTIFPSSGSGQGTPQANVEYGGSYTINGESFSFSLPGGEKGKGGIATDLITQFRLNPGDDIYIRVTNQSGGTANTSVSVVWVELSQ